MTDTGKVLGTLAVSVIGASFTASLVALITHGAIVGAGFAVLFGAVFGLLYGLFTGLLRAYDLSSQVGVLGLIVDLTWSLPNTVAGFILGNLIYIFFGTPSRALSENEGWISYKARGTSGFGVDVLQTIGTVNIGGAGNHEKVHLLQARIFGPFFIPIVIANYILTGTVQVLFTITIGAILKATGKRDTAWLTPPSGSAVKGFFGWIYYATIFELWAYGTEP
ncbi:MAG TPA: hypothetical protein VFU23_02945 [Gemmatimonadales bacterium]|nr:hypothetical protein [Gemmatimonadales bacterium]